MVMPAAVGLLLPASLGSTISVGGITLATSAGLTVAGSILNIAGSLALNAAVSSLLAPDLPPGVTPDNIQGNSKVATGPRTKHVGLTKVGGYVVFHRAKEGTSYRVIVHGHGFNHEFVQYYLNDVPVLVADTAMTIDENAVLGTFDITGNPALVSIDDVAGPSPRNYAPGAVLNSQYYQDRPRVHILRRYGREPSAHYHWVTEIWPEWTGNHRLDGLTTSLVKTESVGPDGYRDMYPNNEPTAQILGKWGEYYDPRTGESKWTENAALIIRDYVASPDGFNRPSAFDVADISALADIADEPVLKATGGTEPKFRLTGSYQLNERPQDVLGRMLEATGGSVRLKPNGKIKMNFSTWEEPEFTIDYGCILELQSIDNGPDLLERYNELPARFISHDLDHVEVDAEAWRDEARIANDGEILVGPQKSLIMCPSHIQARAVMKAATERENPLQRVKIVCKPMALPAIYERFVKVDAPQIGLTGNYEVKRFNVEFDGGQPKAVALNLNLIAKKAFTLGLMEQGKVQEPPPKDETEGVPAVSGFTASPKGSGNNAIGFNAGILVEWDEPPSDHLTVVVRYALSGSGNFKIAEIGISDTSIHIMNLVDQSLYDVSAYLITSSGQKGPEILIEGVSALAAEVVPDAPDTISVTNLGGGQAQVSVETSSTHAFHAIEIFRDNTLVHTSSNPTVNFTDSSGTGVFTWKARTVNVSDLKSVFSSSVTASIT